jgi:hypothetical protein
VVDEPQRQVDRTVAETRDVLDVAIEHQRAELERLQRRIDRIDTQSAGVMTGGAAFGGLSATALSAIDRHLGAASIALVCVGGLCIGVAVFLSLLGGEPRFSSPFGMRQLGLPSWVSPLPVWASGRFFWVVLPAWLRVRRPADGLTPLSSATLTEFVRQVEQLRPLVQQLSIHLPVPPDTSDSRKMAAYLRKLVETARAVLEDRQVAPVKVDVGGVEIRQTVFSSLALRVFVLARIAAWREQLGRQAVLLLTLGILALAGALVACLA